MIGYPEAVAIVGTSFGFFLLAANVLKTFCGNNKEWKDFSKKLSIVLSDIASIKQAVIDLSIFVCDSGSNGKGKELRDAIIDAMMKRNRE